MGALIGNIDDEKFVKLKEYIRGHAIETFLYGVIFSVIAVTAIVFVLNWDDGKKQPERLQLTTEQELDVYNQVREAMLPTSDVYNPEAPTVNFERAKVNMEKLAARNKIVAQSRYYAVNMFEVCYRLSDETCMNKQASIVKSLSTDRDPYTSDTTKEIADKIAKYGDK